jgi:hypothetical protein
MRGEIFPLQPRFSLLAPTSTRTGEAAERSPEKVRIVDASLIEEVLRERR